MKCNEKFCYCNCCFEGKMIEKSIFDNEYYTRIGAGNCCPILWDKPGKETVPVKVFRSEYADLLVSLYSQFTEEFQTGTFKNLLTPGDHIIEKGIPALKELIDTLSHCLIMMQASNDGYRLEDEDLKLKAFSLINKLKTGEKK